MPGQSKSGYSRVLLKLSGEALAGDDKTGINPGIVKTIAKEVVQAHSKGAEIALVIGGGR